MSNFEKSEHDSSKLDISLYLPKHLSQESYEELITKLGNFPNAIDHNLYTTYLQREETVFQGDGLADMPFIKLPNPKVGDVPVIVLSNTCDIDPNNTRSIVNPQITYAAILNLNKYITLLKNKQILNEEQAQSTLAAIRKQKYTQIFYLPKSENGLSYEGIVFLDQVCHCDNKHINRSELHSGKRLFTLSNYGFYLFLMKLSIHFLRMQEGVDRKKDI